MRSLIDESFQALKERFLIYIPTLTLELWFKLKTKRFANSARRILNVKLVFAGVVRKDFFYINRQPNSFKIAKMSYANAQPAIKRLNRLSFIILRL
jgi:hypothetical protein